MPEQTTHPSEAELSAYNLGQLPPDEAAVIENHISECEPCCETIIGMSSDDTFVALLQEARQLPTDQTLDSEGSTAKPSSSSQDIPAPLAEHPRYEILGLIGKGGMGDVYKARHRKMERTVALKVVNRGLVQKTEAVDRFHREVKAAAQLSHPNIVTAYDADQAGDFHFMVMEYVDGVDLSQTVKNRGALPVAEACDYIRQAAIGLQHAHECGMVHRDIKPHNLMVTSDGTVKILDFGLASLAPEAIADADTGEARGDLTAAGAIMGTPDFISPEQAEDAHQADIRSDIYSLGTTLYFLLSGRPPFADGSVMHKLRSHATAEPDALRTLRDDVPRELESIIARMTAKDPVERFQSPNKVAVALEPLVRETPRRRGPFSRLTALAAGFAAMLVAAAVYFIVTNNGVVRIEVLDDSLQVTIDGREVTLNEDGKTVQSFRAGDHEIVVRQGGTELVTDEFELRRNGEVAFRVTVEEGKVVVTRKGEEPKTARLPGARPAAKWPELRITNAGVNSTGFGQVTRTWKLSSHEVGVVTARLVHVTNGKILVANERRIDLSDVPGSSVGHLSLNAVDQPEDRTALSLDMSLTPVGESPASPVRSEAKPLVVDTGIVSSSMTKIAEWDDYGVDANEVVLVHWYAGLSEKFDNLQHGDDLASMVEASKKGARFVVVTLEWNDASGGVSFSPEIVEGLKKSGQDEAEFSKRLQTALSQAAGIPNAQWDKFATDPRASTEGIEGEPLSLVLLRLNPPKESKEIPDVLKDFRLLTNGFPNPRELHEAMAPSQPHGYVSAIQPEYIKRANIDVDPETKLLRGSVEFEAAELYAGSVNFAMEFKHGRMEVVEFALPNYGITISRDNEDTWQSAKPSDQEKLPESALGSSNSRIRTAQKLDADADSKKAGQQRSDNQLQMPLCWCPAGEFKMGREQLPVTLTRGFWIGKYEVTQAQYEAVMGDNPSEYKGESLPVEAVKWSEAKKFCQKFTELERKAGRLPKGLEYRLPTEAQWEYACRAGTTLVWDAEKALVYPSTFGDDLSELGDYAWYIENSDEKTHAVGQKKPNAWGLCDMHGNVFEWVRDAWQSKLTGGKDPEASVWSPVQTLRGGDFFLAAEACGSPFSRAIGLASHQGMFKGFRVSLVSVDESGDGAAMGGDLKLLQGDWDVIAFTQDGKEEFAADKGVGMLVQIKGETISRIQTAPNGEKSEKEWGRIELSSNTNPKSIDIVNPDGPGGRLLGIYELKEGTLKICFAEQRNIDVAEGQPAKRPTTFAAPAGSERVLIECGRKRPEVNTDASSPRVILDQGYKILDCGKAIGFRQLVVTQQPQILSIGEETTLTVMGVLELDSTVDYSLSGDTPEILRAEIEAKSDGNPLMTGSVYFSGGEATVAWTSYSAQGRTLETPSKQKTTVKVPPGPIVFGSTLQTVGALLLKGEGEREVVWAEFDDDSKERLVEFKAGSRIKRTERPQGAGFTITLYKPESSEPEMTLDFDGEGQCERIQSGGVIIQPRQKPLPKAEEERVLFRIETNKPCQEVASAIHQYFVDKYPEFAALNAWNVGQSKTADDFLRKLGQLHDTSPVSKVVNSFPGVHFVTFGERTESSKDQVTVTSVRLFRNEDRTCRIVVVEDNQPKQDGVPFAKGKPITEEDIRGLIKRAAGAAEQAQPPVHSRVATSRKTTAFLVEAAKRGDLDAVNAALKAGVDPNTQHDGYSALYWAAYHPMSKPQIVERLIAAGADVNAKNKCTDGGTPLMAAGTAEVVTMLIEAGVDVNAEHPVNGTALGRVPDVKIANLLIAAGADVNRGRRTPLINAASAGNADLIRFLVENGAKVNDPKNPPLHSVAKPEAAAALLAAGADVNQRDEKGRTVLNLTKGVYNPSTDTVKLLIEAGADVNAKQPSGSAPLHQAIVYGIQEGEPELAEVLVAAGAALDAKDGQGNTPLSLAREGLNDARNDHFSNPRRTAAQVATAEALIRLLEDAGAKDDGRTPLQQAVAAGKLDEVKRLIASGADVNATGTRQITAAHIASNEGRADILELLLEAGARIDQPDEDRQYPLHLAADARTAKVLLAHGAKVDASVERKGPTPFDAAIRAGKADVVRELLRHGAKLPDDEDGNSLLIATYFGRKEVAEILLNSDHTKALLEGHKNGGPLHVAAAGGYLDTECPRYVTPEIRLGLVRLLVKHGADVNARAHVGLLNNMTPLMGAAGSGHVEIVQLLLEHGADVHVADPEGTFGGETAHHIAAKRGNRQIVELLLEAKADINAVTGKEHVDGRKTPLDYAEDPEVKLLLLQNGGKTAIDVIGRS